MLAPVSEVDHAEPPVVAAGLDSVARWKRLLGDALAGVGSDRGSLLTALRPEWPLLDQLADRVRRAGLGDRLVAVDPDRLRALEPALAGRFVRAWHTRDEGVVDPPAALSALDAAYVAEGGRVVRGWAAEVGAHQVALDGDEHPHLTADLVVDARGLAARDTLALRGVRGEFVEVHTDEVVLGRPVRVLHPRHPLYVVPRGGGRFYVGATEVEREDDAPPTVRSLLELLSVLHAVHPAFAEAEVVRSGVGLRPALPDNAPRIVAQEGLIRVNGLHRHGWLLAPILADAVAGIAAGSAVPTPVLPFVEAA